MKRAFKLGLLAALILLLSSSCKKNMDKQSVAPSSLSQKIKKFNDCKQDCQTVFEIKLEFFCSGEKSCINKAKEERQACQASCRL